MGRSRYQFAEKDRPHFLTITTNNWIPVFTRPDTVEIILNSWRFLQSDKDFKLYGYVILENHLHLIAQSGNLPNDIKAFTARRIIDLLQQHNSHFLLKQLAFYKKAHKTRSQHQLWQEGSHPQLISNDSIL